MPDAQAREAIRSGIRAVLTDFVERPFFDVREADVQARLLHEVRTRLRPPDVSLELRPHGGHPVHQIPPGVRTSRVHLEAKLGPKLQVDLVVLAVPGPAELVVHVNGPLDVIAPVKPEHLAAVIEVKAAPSKNMWRDFGDDLRKLNEVLLLAPECDAFFVAFDKSLPLGGADTPVVPNFGWLDALIEDPAGCIEAHYVDDAGKLRSRRGRLVQEHP